MPVRYPLLFSNIRSYRFLRKYPFIPSGYAISFISNVHSHERYLAALHTRQRPAFSLCRFSIPSTGNRQDSPTLIHRTRRLSALHPLKSTAKQPYGLVGRHTRLCRFHLASERHVSYPWYSSRLHAGISRPLCCQADKSFRTKSATICLASSFRDRFLSKSSSLFRCKVSMQTGTAMRP